MPNAGHTYVDPEGKKYVFKVLPSGAVGKNIKQIMIGPGAVFSITRLIEEIKQLPYNGQRIIIHPNAMVLSQKHVNAEQVDETLGGISSTLQGSSAAMIDKIKRSAMLAKDFPALRHFVAVPGEWEKRLMAAQQILAEGSQGYSLGINTQFYPFTTSRDCTPVAFLSGLGIPIKMLREIIGTVRTYPIRVGGPSGDYYEDQHETNWEKLNQPEERTTVTNKIRRVFTWSDQQFREAAFYCGPDRIFLNFMNYHHFGREGRRVVKTIDSFKSLFHECGAKLSWTGWGPNHNDVVTEA